MQVELTVILLEKISFGINNRLSLATGKLPIEGNLDIFFQIITGLGACLLTRGLFSIPDKKRLVAFVIPHILRDTTCNRILIGFKGIRFTCNIING